MEDNTEKCYCLICEKEIDVRDEYNIIDGGKVSFDFNFGSRYDCTHSSEAKEKDELLAAVDLVTKCYIHDDCFKAKCHLMKGFEIQTFASKYKRIV